MVVIWQELILICQINLRFFRYLLGMSISQPDERLIQIAFLATPGIGRKTFKKVEHNQEVLQICWSEFWQSPGQWGVLGLTENQQQALKNFQNKFTPKGYAQYLIEKEIRVITFEDNNYPKLLNQIDDKPLILYIKGPDIAQSLPAISVVGTRKITNYGRLATAKIVSELVQENCVIVSGFMYGVDFCAHQTALDKSGQTVGVLGFGFEHFYPSVYERYYREMLALGMTFLTEYAPFVQPTQGSFPERNRIVAGLSLGTVVVEAGEASGTMITSRLAGEFGRTVFAVPGSIFSPYSQGTKLLVNQGACLVSSGAEMLAELGLKSSVGDRLLQLGSAIVKVGQEIIDELKLGEANFAHLAKISGLKASDLSSTLLQLEVAGVVERRGEVWTIKI